MFFDRQDRSNIIAYVETLQAVGSISKLFSDSAVPYLNYRASENIFCRSLNAVNLSRGDITFDALKDGIGIALKTFQHRNGRCVEKIAEFNDDVTSFQGRSDHEIMHIVSNLRNHRIDLALDITDAREMIYHLVTRKEGSFEIFEEELEYIDLNRLRLLNSTTAKALWFTDGRHEYKFSKSKSTLYKRFITENPVFDFGVDIAEDPYGMLMNYSTSDIGNINEFLQPEIHESIVLPLYSARSGEVEAKSGLNQWNALGRPRHEDEVYIPIPSWIHRRFEGFFPYNRHTDWRGEFTLMLPNGREIPAKICQQGGKGFMSNPNRVLGEWLLRNVLHLPPHHLVSYSDLEDAGIDSVIVTKMEEGLFQIDFADLGTYQEFEDNNK